MSLLPFAAVFAAVTMLGAVLASQSETSLVRIGDYTAAESIAPTPAPPPAALVQSVGAAAVGQPLAVSPSAGAPVPSGASVARASGDKLIVVRGPSIDVDTIRRVLRAYNSPALADAQAIYDLGVRYGIDPAVCLAFFIVESSAGTRGMATETRSLGNIRATPGYLNHKGYRKYATWREGIEDWYRLIARLYVGEWGLTSVEMIVPVYAPAEDSNDPARYIGTVRRLVRTWTGT